MSRLKINIILHHPNTIPTPSKHHPNTIHQPTPTPDPPRIWSPHGEYPGTAFTRSLGDSYAEELGVFAEPEMITRTVRSNDKIIVVASDGVFEFLTNQSVVDMCAKFDDPLEACRAVVAEAYELWLQYELRTDDITMICIFVDEGGDDADAARGKDQGIAQVEDIMLEGVKPVRRNVSKRKKKAMVSARKQADDVDFDMKQVSGSGVRVFVESLL